MVDNKNLILAVVLSVAILVGFDFFFGSKFTPLQTSQQTAGQTAPTPATGTPPAPATGSAPSDTPMAPGAAPTATAATPTVNRADVLAKTPRVRIKGPRLHGSIDLRGGRLDDLTLADYRETIEPNSPEIVLLSPSGAKNTYFAEVGWIGDGTATVPNQDTVWTADKDVLTPGDPVTLSWDNGQGLVFKRTFALDKNYLFTIDQTVENTGEQAVKLFPYALSSRKGLPTTSGFYILHEGMLGVFDETLKEVDYDEVEAGKPVTVKSTGGWIGITDKYWLVSLIPDQKDAITARFTHSLDGGVDKFQVDFVGAETAVQPGATASVQSRVFAGAKEVKLLDAYSDNLGIQRLDLAIDFGWFFYLTKPIFYILSYIHGYVGNFGIAIMLLTVMIKLLMFPLANKSYRSMSKMKKLQPEMLKLRERFGDDKARLNQEMMALYKREKANPASGCLPMLVQIPVFFALYKVLYVSIEMRHAPFFGWIQDLSAPDPTTMFNLFGLIDWMPPEYLMIGVWPLIMGVTMFLQQKLNPQPADPVQAKIFMFLPLIFTVMLSRFSAGLVIYWAWNNSLSILQQWVIMRRAGTH